MVEVLKTQTLVYRNRLATIEAKYRNTTIRRGPGTATPAEMSLRPWTASTQSVSDATANGHCKSEIQRHEVPSFDIGEPECEGRAGQPTSSIARKCIREGEYSPADAVPFNAPTVKQSRMSYGQSQQATLALISAEIEIFNGVSQAPT